MSKIKNLNSHKMKRKSNKAVSFYSIVEQKRKHEETCRKNRKKRKKKSK